MLTYTKAKELIARSRSGRVRLAHETFLVQEESVFKIYYHRTPVVTLFEEGTYILNSGGYRTYTTKKRINDYSPASVFQRRYEWFTTGLQRFYDGIKVNSEGEVLFPYEPA